LKYYFEVSKQSFNLAEVKQTIMKKNTIKGIAKGVGKSVYPNGIKSQKEWRETHTSKRFNDTFHANSFESSK
jgi:hypothetical protein